MEIRLTWITKNHREIIEWFYKADKFKVLICFILYNQKLHTGARLAHRIIVIHYTQSTNVAKEKLIV